MKKILVLFFLLNACTQRGLLGVEQPVQDTGSSSSGSTSSGSFSSAAASKVAVVKADLFNTNAYLNTSFAETYGNFPNVQGHPYVQGSYGTSTGKGDEYCISNEKKPDAVGDLDAAVPCFTPLSSTATSGNFTNENTMRTALANATPTVGDIKTDASGYPMIIQALQLYFNDKRPPIPTNNKYTQIAIENLWVKTAPIVFTASTGVLSWDDSQSQTYVYAGDEAGCTPTDSGNNGFDLENVAYKDNKNKAIDNSTLFLTGLWLFERAENIPFENNTYQIQDSNTTLSNLFTTRARIFSSFIFPYVVNPGTTQHAGFKYFPGTNSSASDDTPSYFAPSTEPNPQLFSFGKYKNCGAVPLGNGTFLSEPYDCNVTKYDDDTTSSRKPPNSWTVTETQDGVTHTPFMGRYKPDGSLISEWSSRVIIGFCITGTRFVYGGTTTSIPPDGNPIFPAIKYELRKISVKLQ